MILEDEKKKIILKRLRKSAMEIFFTMLLISLSSGIFIMFVLGFLADIGLSGGVFAGELVAIVIFLGRLDDILIVVCVLVECLKLEKSETKNTIRAYIEYLKNAFIVSEVNRFDVKGRK